MLASAVKPSVCQCRTPAFEAGGGRSARPHQATSRPSAPPAAPSSRDSVSSWRMSLARVAPSERRIEISLCRRIARDSIRLATFAQMMSRTIATTAERILAAVTAASSTSYTPRAPDSSTSRGISPWRSCWARSSSLSDRR